MLLSFEQQAFSGGHKLTGFINCGGGLYFEGKTCPGKLSETGCTDVCLKLSRKNLVQCPGWVNLHRDKRTGAICPIKPRTNTGGGGSGSGRGGPGPGRGRLGRGGPGSGGGGGGGTGGGTGGGRATNQNPTARFTISNTRIKVDVPVRLNGSTSSDPDGSIKSYTWSFTNATTTSATGARASVTFNKLGTGTISLVVSDNGGAKSTAVRKSIRVNAYGSVRNRGTRSGGVICNNGTNPVNGADGNKVQPETDYTSTGNFPLSFTRYYNSLATKTKTLGNNWRHHYEQSIELDNNATPNQAYVFLADGSSIRFTQTGNSWKAAAGVSERLTRTALGWQLTDNNDTVYTYNNIVGSDDARLSKITTRAGFTQTLNYVSNRLANVVDHFGNSIRFGYDATGRMTSLTDLAGKTIHYSYRNNTLVTVTFQDLTTRQYLYEHASFPHHLTGIIDQSGKRFASWSYDATGRAISSRHAGGANKVTIVYNANGTTTFTDALGQARTHSFTNVNGIQKLVKITGPACNVCGGRSQNNTYDANGNFDLVTDFNGSVTDYNYNARGLIEQVIEAKGKPEQTLSNTIWHRQYRVPTCIITERATTLNRYSANGQLIASEVYDTSNATLFRSAASKTCTSIASRRNLPRRATTYGYFANGLLQKVDGPRIDVQDITTYQYDSKGNVSTITNAVGAVTTLRNYTAAGQAQTLVDANGLITTITYDALGRKDIVTVGGLATNYDYYANGLLDKVTLADGSFVDYRYDDAERLIDIYDQSGNHIHYTLNLVGSRVKTDISDPANVLKRTQSTLYDLQNRLKKTIGAASQTTDYLRYDGNGNIKQVRDPGLHTTSYRYDALDRLTSTTDATQGTSRNVYDVQNNLISVTDARGLVTRYTYDGLGNLLQTTSPDTGMTRNTAHDAKGNVLSTTNALGNTTRYHYDALNRLDLITYQDGTTTDYVYDVGLNAKGRLSSITYHGGAASLAGSITDSWRYDKNGRVLSKTQTNGTVNLTTRYAYHASTGQLQTITTPGGHSIVYGYVNDKVSSIAVDSKQVMSNINYDPFGPATTWTFGNGIAVSRVYDQDGQLVRYPEAGVIMQNTYTPTGNLKNIIEVGSSILDAAYTYDALNRVMRYAADGNTEAYSYDANSNRLSQKINLLNYTSNYATRSNQLLSRRGPPTAKTYVYDASGNTTADGRHTYQYDARGRLTGMDNNYVQYAINGLGQRIRKRGGFKRSGDLDEDGVVNTTDRTIVQNAANGSLPAAEAHDRNNDSIVNQADVTQFDTMSNSGKDAETFDFDQRFVYNAQGQLEGEYDTNGQMVQEYIWFAGQAIALLRGGEIFYIDSNHLGSPTSISDQAQEVVWEWDTDPYGKALPDVDFDGDQNLFVFNLRFPGQYFDHESGLHYNINRFYDPSTGRYLEADPIGLAGGLNLYGYVGGNPVNNVDALGLRFVVRLPQYGRRSQSRRSQPFINARVKLLRYKVRQYDPSFYLVRGTNRNWNPSTIRFLEQSLNNAKAAGFCGPGAASTLRPDIVLSGGRNGSRVKFLNGPVNSAVRGSNGRIYITNATGQVTRDVSRSRVKPVYPGKGFGSKRSPTKLELELIRRLYGGE